MGAKIFREGANIGAAGGGGFGPYSIYVKEGPAFWINPRQKACCECMQTF